MLKAIARQIPQIDRLITQRDDLLRQRDELAREVERHHQEIKTLGSESLDGPPCPLYERMKAHVATLPADSRVLELGTLRWRPDDPTIHRHYAPHVEWIGSDIQAGTDVDIVADAHSLTTATGRDQFDFILACSVFEHLARPWIAAKEIALALKPGGQVYIQTHFAFGIHGYPSDYFRFTTEALALLFEDAGLHKIETSYAFPARIISKQEPNTKLMPAYLNTNLLAAKARH
jgi:SAM-dependent methyltransferase